jgi:succinate dehydrogenase hydrophobic anchor subunit
VKKTDTFTTVSVTPIRSSLSIRFAFLKPTKRATRIKNVPLSFSKPTVTLNKLICLVLMLAVSFAGMRPLLNDLVTPAHLHLPLSSTATGTAINMHEHSSVDRHIHESSFRSVKMIVSIDHETGNDFSAEKSVSKVSFDCDLLATYHRSEIASKSTYGTIAPHVFTSALRQRIDRPPILI